MAILSVAKREKFSRIIFKSLNFSKVLGYVEQKVSQNEISYHGMVGKSERYGAVTLVHQDSVGCVHLDVGIPHGLERELHQFAIPVQHIPVADVDQGGVESLLPVGVQPVACHVVHLLGRRGGRVACIFQGRGVVWDAQANAVDALEVLALYG